MKENKGSLYLLTGLVIGIVLGMVYGWVFHPLQNVDADPSILKEELKDQYRILIALAYRSDGDLVRARARLELLEDGNVNQALEEQAQSVIARGGSETAARALAQLAAELESEP